MFQAKIYRKTEVCNYDLSAYTPAKDKTCMSVCVEIGVTLLYYILGDTYWVIGDD